MHKTEFNTIKTTGIVNPTDWDDNGNIIEISLSLPGEIDYIIESNKKGKKLQKLLNKEIRVLGKLYKDKLNRDYISIIDYEVLKNYE